MDLTYSTHNVACVANIAIHRVGSGVCSDLAMATVSASGVLPLKGKHILKALH